MSSTLKLSRVQRKGQITIPANLRQRLGIQEGDFVAFVETADGILITPHRLIPSDLIERVDAIKAAIKAADNQHGPRPSSDT